MVMFSSRTFLSQFHEYCRRRRLIGEHSKIIVAVSGGADSVVLLDLLAKEQESLGLSLIVAHFNHQLRGSESEGDEEFVAQRASHYNIELYVERANTAEIARLEGCGIQETARDLRYAFFQKLLNSSGFDRVATAHNADDNAETMLLNLFRGAGVQGLSGIPVYRQDTQIIRPLLFAQRKEIEEYAEQEQLPFRTDSSNVNEHYTRNFIRHRILPLVKDQINPSVVQTLQRTSQLFRELEAYLSFSARQALDLAVVQKADAEIHLSIPRLRCNPVLLQQYMVLLAVEQTTGARPEYEAVGAILELTEGLTGSWVTLPDDYLVFRDRETLVVRKTEQIPDFRIVVQQNSTYEFDAFRFASSSIDGAPPFPQENGSVEYVDADRVKPGDLILRTWQDGDAFMPLGMKAMKKISDFFVDARIPVYEKRGYPILETRDGEIVWVCGQRIDERFKVTPETRRILKLEYTRSRKKANGEGTHG
jgi:tRNA(Ile)-lysidine synthase